MDYKKLYDKIIENSKNKNRSKKYGIFERHHIIPKCLGGTNEKSNLVLVTPREHFILHMLLWKTDKNNYKLFAPLMYFKRHKHVKSARAYEKIREEHTKFMHLQNPSKTLNDTSKKSKSEKLKNYASNRTKIHNERISKSKKGFAARQGVILSNETKNKISDSLKKHFSNNKISDETRKKISIKSSLHKHSDETKQKLSEAAYNRKKYSCAFCNYIFPPSQWHQHMKKTHNWDKEKIEMEKANYLVKPEGWSAPNHSDNLGYLKIIKSEDAG
jgi:hypothetical protein